jgi:L-aminopeptidase/D-esterase-like protein
MEETEEHLMEEPSDEPVEETAEQEEAAVPEELPEVITVSEDIPEVIAEEEPVALTREEMGYDIVFNTTISCLITNAELTKSQANKLASILHDAYARAIKPVHGTLDGDTVFVLATGKQKVNFDAFAALATDVMQYAIIDGALSAEGAYGLPAARDMQ